MIEKTNINQGLWKSDKNKQTHLDVICDFLNYLNTNSKEYILKGGTALMVCYGLDRFSEDIDLDSVDKQIGNFVKTYAMRHNYDFRVAKDTLTTKRFMLHYDTNHSPLKIEVSYRQKQINPQNVENRNGVMVYNLKTLLRLKTLAYSGRDRIRDLYDVTYIVNQYYDQFEDFELDQVKEALMYKGLEQFDYIVSTQDDKLIDKSKLANDFLEMFDRLGIIDDYEMEL